MIDAGLLQLLSTGFNGVSLGVIVFMFSQIYALKKEVKDHAEAMEQHAAKVDKALEQVNYLRGILDGKKEG